MPTHAPYPPAPLTAPSPWLPLLEPEGEKGRGPGNESPLPGEGWPQVETIEYVSKLITLILLLLALPWLTEKLLTHPGAVSRHSASLAAPGPAGA
jgi:hypothetical protein